MIIARRIYKEIMSEGNLKVIDELLSQNFIDHNLVPGKEAGIKEVKKGFLDFRIAFPDAHADIQDMLLDGDKVITRFIWHGTHKGEFMGIEPTGKKVAVTIIDILLIKNGKVLERWGVEDNLSLWRQLGVQPPISR